MSRITLVAATALALALPAIATARPVSDSGAIRAEYRRFARACETRQAAQLSSLFTDDYTLEGDSGRVIGRADALAALAGEAGRMLPPVRVRTDLVRLAVVRDSARTEVWEETACRVKDAAGAVHSVRRRRPFTDFFVRTPQGWRRCATLRGVAGPTWWVDEAPASPERAAPLLGGR